METKHLVIFEKSMNSRFIGLADKNKMSYSTFNMENEIKGNFLLTIINRLINRASLYKKIQNEISFIKENGIDVVYLSNTEGYIAFTGATTLKKKLPKLKIIALQHGIFPLESSLFNTVIKKVINKIIYTCFGIFAFGEGFGSLKVNRYIVYGNPENEFLINTKNWGAKDVEVNLKFLKSYLLKKDEINFTNSNNNVILLLQSLSDSRLCSKKNENILIEQTIKYLSKKYNKVYIKEHPYCKKRIQKFKLPENTEIIDNMISGFYKSQKAYSFFSTALIDAKFFNLETVAIYSSKIKVKRSIYQSFETIVNFENEIRT